MYYTIFLHSLFIRIGQKNIKCETEQFSCFLFSIILQKLVDQNKHNAVYQVGVESELRKLSKHSEKQYEYP